MYRLDDKTGYVYSLEEWCTVYRFSFSSKEDAAAYWELLPPLPIDPSSEEELDTIRKRMLHIYGNSRYKEGDVISLMSAINMKYIVKSIDHFGIHAYPLNEKGVKEILPHDGAYLLLASSRFYSNPPGITVKDPSKLLKLMSNTVKL